MNLPDLPFPDTLIRTRRVGDMTCPFGHQLLHAGDSIYYCSNEICEVAVLHKRNRIVFISLEEAHSLLAGDITKAEVLEAEQLVYERREWLLRRKFA